jgi:hypothetical protein
MNLDKLKSFLERAVECELLASKATDPRNRKVFLYVASSWRALAAEEAGQQIPRNSDHKPLSSEDKSNEQ